MKIYYLDSNLLSEEQLKKIYSNAENYRKIKYDRISDTVSKKECIASDALIKFGVRDYLNDKSQNPITDYLESGKLILKNIRLHLCISHTCGHVFLVLHNSNVGIDAEYIREIDYQKLFNRYFKGIKKQPKSNIDFFKEWTALEARFKCENRKALSFDNSFATPVSSFTYKNFVLSIACENLNNDSEINIYEINTEDL